MEDLQGVVIISPQVITTVVRQVAESTPGVARLARGFSGGMRRVIRARHADRAVDVQVEDGVVSVDLYVVAMPDTQLLPLGRTLQSCIYRALADVIGMPVRAVNVHFTDVHDPYAAPQ